MSMTAINTNYKTQIINNVYLKILISFVKLLQSIILSIIFIPVLHVTFEHKFVIANFTKHFLLLIVKELSILDHSSSLKTPTI